MRNHKSYPSDHSAHRNCSCSQQRRANNRTKANFSGILTKQILPVAVSEVKHAARVKIDEEGCEAAAYTVVQMTGGAPAKPEEPLEFTVDRPFMFAITGPGNTILFAGIVENP